MDERKRSLRKEIVRLAFPIALQQFMTALVGACDAIMLGKLSRMPCQPYHCSSGRNLRIYPETAGYGCLLCTQSGRDH